MKQKKLKVAFCNPTGPHHYKSSVKDTVLKFFWNQNCHVFDAEFKQSL